MSQNLLMDFVCLSDPGQQVRQMTELKILDLLWCSKQEEPLLWWGHEMVAFNPFPWEHAIALAAMQIGA